MIQRVIVRRGTYQDSARLMRIARDLGGVAGIRSADVMMGTPANIDLLARAGFPRMELTGASAMDMVAALAGEDDAALAAAEDRLATLLTADSRQPTADSQAARIMPGSIAEAVRLHPGASLVSIAVPGPYAAFAANRALDAGRHVFLFSDNVPIEHEVALKRRGCSSGLLVMGPDCGTAIIAGVGLGFANRVAGGPVGIVGASGTGIQELCCALSRLGVGVSHAIGTGSRDLSGAVNGVMSEFALRLLAADTATRVIVLVAKHPAPEVADRLHGVLASLGKPAIVRFLGEDPRQSTDGVMYAETLDEAAEIAAARPDTHGRTFRASARDGRTKSAVSGRLIGLFGGGSLAAEAQHVLATRGVEKLIVDTGDDAYTVGRPHPMVDQTVRCDLIRAAGADRSVALILLDLVLGDGAHPDPAPEIAAAVAGARAARDNAPLAVVCSVCGTPADPQDVARQVAVLEAAGIQTAPTAAQAALLAAEILR